MVLTQSPFRHCPHCHGGYHRYLRAGRVGLDCKRFATEGCPVHGVHSAGSRSRGRSGRYGSWVGSPLETMLIDARSFEANHAILSVLPLVLSVTLVSAEQHSNPDSTLE